MDMMTRRGEQQDQQGTYDGWEKELWLVRHGTTAWNTEKRYLGHTDIGLLPEAEQELASLREHLVGIEWRSVHSSDLLRCRQTLEWVAPLHAGQAHMDSRLREIHFGEWEGRTYEELKHLARYREWIDSPQTVTPPGGEPWSSFAARIDDFLNEVIWAEPRHERTGDSTTAQTKDLVIAHGGVIRYMLTRLLPGQAFWDVSVIPGQAIRLQLECSRNGRKAIRLPFPEIGL
ncbi:histidine phosphatase family protein [Paenibacillus hubeiensis]|uniref:histidine phosphatase family protein n=1 Tax=Paenibacillus hubeiensis TaxID=3077330 RepID=UPI0031BA9FBD